MIVLYQILVVCLIGLSHLGSALKLPSFRASVSKIGQNIKHLKTSTKVPKKLRSAIAHGGIITTSLFMPRKVVYASTEVGKNMKPPTEIVTQKERTSPRDVWSGQKKAKRPTDIVQSSTLKAPTMIPIAIDKSKLSGSFVRDAVRSVGPSVVRIDCEREVPAINMMFQPELFKEGDVMKISGSGFVVSRDGYIMTNQHVVEASKKTTVTLANGRTFRARVVAEDELTDLAVLKVDIPRSDAAFLQTAPIGDSSSLQSGDWVIAVGCPVGLDFSCSLGIVSSPLRSASEVGATHLKGTYIQTDAALNSGNSGGPLVNDLGEVVGINTMVRTNTEAIGFAIPINRARIIFDVLKQGKKPTHAFFGLEVTTITPDYAQIHNEDPNAQRLPELHGALVNKVLPGAPAAACGIRRNDIIIEVNGIPIASTHDADVHLDACAPGQVAKIKVARGEGASMVELQATPRDVLQMILEKRQRRSGGAPQAMIVPPGRQRGSSGGGAPQRPRTPPRKAPHEAPGRQRASSF